MTGQAIVAPGRFATLDALRGVAALSVLGYHAVNTVIVPGRSLVTDLFLQGWLGVFVFFPISGYCILAATCAGRDTSIGRFLRRRWLRIFPTYWASIAVTLLLLFISSPFSSASLEQLSAPGWNWLSILTLTQTLTGMPNAINPVYWSLCYEEQFYLLVALSLLLPMRLRAGALLSVSIATCGWRLLAGPTAISGWFVDFWLEFAVGMAVFGWSHPSFGRAWAMTLIGLNVLVCVAQGQLAPATSTTIALVMLAARRWDHVIAQAGLMRALAAVGMMSYSLYLIHVPVAGRVVNGLSRLVDRPSQFWIPLLVAAAVSAMVAAYVFYRMVEVRFQPRPAEPSSVPTDARWAHASVLAGGGSP